MTLHLVEGLVLKFGEQKAFLCQVCTWQWSHILVFWATFSGALGRRDSCKILQVNHLKRFVIWSTLPNKYERNFSQATTTTAKHLALNICISFLGVCECSGWERNIFEFFMHLDDCFLFMIKIRKWDLKMNFHDITWVHFDPVLVKPRLNFMA